MTVYQLFHCLYLYNIGEENWQVAYHSPKFSHVWYISTFVIHKTTIQCNYKEIIKALLSRSLKCPVYAIVL